MAQPSCEHAPFGKKKKWLKWLALGAIAAALAIQLVRVPHENPEATAPLAVPPQVDALLDRACNDCHSNETKWPWYGEVAPISWLVYSDVREGRAHLNFSEWPSEPRKRRKLFHEIEKAVSAGDMPLPIYVPLHAEAKLSDAEKKLLAEWASESMMAGIE